MNLTLFRAIPCWVLAGILWMGSCSHPSLFQPAPGVGAGSLTGGSAVNDNGSASYTLSISVPPGTAGVQPNLSVVCNSRAGNGILGVGWELSGLSLITRIGTNIATDGVTRGIALDQGDRFAIDGQRLIAYRDSAGRPLTTPGARDSAYGLNGTEYRTEIESWTRIISSGSCGGGPCSFTAYSKDGSRSEYAVAADSRLIVRGSPAVVMWGVDKVTDPNGNYVRVRYRNDSLQGSFLPDRIEYTGNQRGNLLPQRMVRFDFEPRSDTLSRSVGGIHLSLTQRLNRIQTYVVRAGGPSRLDDTANLVLQYRVGYVYSPATGRSLVRQVSECDASGSCLPPTRFDWSKPDSLGEFTGVNTTLPNSFWPNISPNTVSVKADFDGDGKTDIALFNQDALTVPMLFSRGSRGFTTTADTLPAGFSNFFSDLHGMQVGDFNGDGKTDIAQVIPGRSYIPILLSLGNGRFSGKRVALPSGMDSSIMATGVQLFAADLNGDGLTDLAGFKTGYTSVPILFMKPDLTLKGTRVELPIATARAVNAPGVQKMATDLNGDGLTDFACFGNGYGTVPVLLSQGDGSFACSSYTLPGNFSAAFNSSGVEKITGDFNGDGLADIAAFSNGYVTVPMLFSLGNGQFTTAMQPMPAGFATAVNAAGAQRMTGDFNGDGLTDIAVFSAGLTSIPLLYSRGTGTFTGVLGKMDPSFAGILNASDIERLIGDFNGDGLIDITGFKPGYKTLPILFCSRPGTVDNLPDLLVRAEDGVGAIRRLRYSPLTDNEIYHKDSGARYPVVDAQPASFVVAKQRDSLRGDSAHSSCIDYRYAGATIDLHRGWIGFHQTSRIDSAHDARTVTETYGFFPLSGMIARRQLQSLSRPGQIAGIASYQLGYQNVDSTGVYRVWQSVWGLKHYTGGNFNYELQKYFHYDDEHRNIRSIASIGPPGADSNNSYEFISYDTTRHDLAHWWRTFQPVARKTRRSADSCRWDRWDVQRDMHWDTFAYDSLGNCVSHSRFRDYNGDTATMDWVTYGAQPDLYGNTVVNSRPVQGDSLPVTDTTVFEDFYHTFPLRVITASPGPGDTLHLRTQLAYEPLFGTNISMVDANGNYVFSIPSGGLDGFGRILSVEGNDPYEPVLQTMSVNRYLPDTVANGMDVQVFSRSRWGGAGQPDSTWLWEKTHYDGKGRAIHELRKGPAAGSDIATGREVDGAGLVKKEFLPYFISDTALTPLYYRQEYTPREFPTTTSAPDPAVRGRHFVKRDYRYDSTDDRWITIRKPDAARKGGMATWRVHLDERDNLLSSAGPYDSAGKAYRSFSSSHYVYDVLGRLVTIVDPLAIPIRYRYNSLNQLIAETRQESGTVYLSYSKDGQVARRRDAAGSVQLYTYDHLGRLVCATARKPGQPFQDSTLYRYDDDSAANGIGRLTGCRFAGGSYRYGYDRTGRNDRMTVTIDSLHASFFSITKYDAAGRVEAELSPDSAQTDYLFDRAGNPGQVLRNGDTLASFGDYTAAGMAGSIRYRNGIVSRLDYDLLGRPLRSRSGKNAYTARDFGYRWNLADRLDTIIDARLSPEPDLTQRFQYDNAGRLIRADGADEDETFELDASGNRLSDQDYVYGYSNVKRNQLISATARRGGGSYSLGYDSAGNLVSEHLVSPGGARHRPAAKGTMDSGSPDSVRYHYGATGDMSSMELYDSAGRDSSRYRYSIGGNRFVKKDPDGTITYYVSPVFEVTRLPGGQLIHTSYVAASGGVLYARSDTGIGNTLRSADAATHVLAMAGSHRVRPVAASLHTYAAGALAFWCLLGLLSVCVALSAGRHRWQLWRAIPLFASLLILSNPAVADIHPGANGPGIPVAGQEVYFHQDYLGNSIFLTDAHGGLTSGIQYRPFGEINKAGSEGVNNFRPKFTGKELESKKGLYYFGSRYYDGRRGRFLSPDPAGQYFSPYIYGDNDPLGGVDPNGQEFVMAIALVTAAVIGAYAGAAVLNGSMNPIDWDWKSGKTWVGLISGAFAGIATVASGGAAISSFGLVAAESVAVSGMSAGSIALSSMDMAFLTYDAYAFGNDPTLGSAAALGMDIIPFVGQLLGKASHGAEVGKMADNSVESSADAYRTTTAEVESSACMASFEAGTKVLTEQGEKPIEKVDVGERVFGKEDATGRRGLFAVSKVIHRAAAALVVLTLSTDPATAKDSVTAKDAAAAQDPGTATDTVTATANHPFRVLGKGWTEAAQLQPGDTLETWQGGGGSGAHAVVRSVAAKPGPGNVYNLEVERSHDYYVGRMHLLAHNPKCVVTRTPGVKKSNGKPYDRVTADIDINTYQQGSATNKAARQYVNNPATPVPVRIKYKYQAVDATGAVKGANKHNVMNPGIPGVPWDAGHVLGRQHGGSGIDVVNLFPQNRDINRGNNGQFGLWRRVEDKVAEYQQQFTVHVTIKLYY